MLAGSEGLFKEIINTASPPLSAMWSARVISEFFHLLSRVISEHCEIGHLRFFPFPTFPVRAPLPVLTRKVADVRFAECRFQLVWLFCLFSFCKTRPTEFIKFINRATEGARERAGRRKVSDREGGFLIQQEWLTNKTQLINLCESVRFDVPCLLDRNGSLCIKISVAIRRGKELTSCHPPPIPSP